MNKIKLILAAIGSTVFTLYLISAWLSNSFDIILGTILIIFYLIRTWQDAVSKDGEE